MRRTAMMAAASLLIALSATSARAGFAGDTVQVLEYFPSIGAVYGSAGPAAAPTIFPDVGQSLVDLSIDDTIITLSPTVSYTPSAASFNGFDVMDLNTLTHITGVSLGTGSASLPGGNLTFDIHDVLVNVASVPLVVGSPIIVDVTFAASAVPEPSTGALMIAGVGIIGAIMSRRRTLQRSDS